MKLIDFLYTNNPDTNYLILLEFDKGNINVDELDYYLKSNPNFFNELCNYKIDDIKKISNKNKEIIKEYVLTELKYIFIDDFYNLKEKRFDLNTTINVYKNNNCKNQDVFFYFTDYLILRDFIDLYLDIFGISIYKEFLKRYFYKLSNKNKKEFIDCHFSEMILINNTQLKKEMTDILLNFLSLTKYKGHLNINALITISSVYNKKEELDIIKNLNFNLEEIIFYDFIENIIYGDGSKLEYFKDRFKKNLDIIYIQDLLKKVEKNTNRTLNFRKYLYYYENKIIQFTK